MFDDFLETAAQTLDEPVEMIKLRLGKAGKLAVNINTNSNGSSVVNNGGSSASNNSSSKPKRADALNHNTPWTDADRLRLKQEYEEYEKDPSGLSSYAKMCRIGTAFQRTPGAIIFQLANMGYNKPKEESEAFFRQQKK